MGGAGPGRVDQARQGCSKPARWKTADLQIPPNYCFSSIRIKSELVFRNHDSESKGARLKLICSTFDCNRQNNERHKGVPDKVFKPTSYGMLIHESLCGGQQCLLCWVAAQSTANSMQQTVVVAHRRNPRKILTKKCTSEKVSNYRRKNWR